MVISQHKQDFSFEKVPNLWLHTKITITLKSRYKAKKQNKIKSLIKTTNLDIKLMKERKFWVLRKETYFIFIFIEHKLILSQNSPKFPSILFIYNYIHPSWITDIFIFNNRWSMVFILFNSWIIIFFQIYNTR